MKVVDAVKAKLAMPNLKVQYTIVTPANRILLVQNGTVDLECSTTTNTTARAQQVEFAPTHFVGSVAAAVKRSSGIDTMAQLRRQDRGHGDRQHVDPTASRLSSATRTCN